MNEEESKQQIIAYKSFIHNCLIDSDDLQHCINELVEDNLDEAHPNELVNLYCRIITELNEFYNQNREYIDQAQQLPTSFVVTDEIHPIDLPHTINETLQGDLITLLHMIGEHDDAESFSLSTGTSFPFYQTLSEISYLVDLYFDCGDLCDMFPNEGPLAENDTRCRTCGMRYYSYASSTEKDDEIIHICHRCENKLE